MSALSDRMAGMTRKQAHELNDREAINEFDRLAAEREREDAPPLKERQASWGETREELIALRAELSALKARRCDGCAHWRRVTERWDGTLGQCVQDATTETFEQWVAFTVPWAGADDADLISWRWRGWALITRESHSCAAWTEKP